MAKKITINHPDGSQTDYQSTILRGYHLKKGKDGVCVTEKRLFEREKLVECYRNVDAEVERCEPCEIFNPTQRPD